MEDCASKDNQVNNISIPSKDMLKADLKQIASLNYSHSNDDGNVIPTETLIKYFEIGLKVVPLGKDCRTPTIRSTTEIYNNPEYWTRELLEQEHYRFNNMATTFGKTHINDENG